MYYIKNKTHTNIDLAKRFMILKWTAVAGLVAMVVCICVFMCYHGGIEARLKDLLPTPILAMILLLVMVLVMIATGCWLTQYELYPSSSDGALMKPLYLTEGQKWQIKFILESHEAHSSESIEKKVKAHLRLSSAEFQMLGDEISEYIVSISNTHA